MMRDAVLTSTLRIDSEEQVTAAGLAGSQTPGSILVNDPVLLQSVDQYVTRPFPIMN